MKRMLHGMFVVVAVFLLNVPAARRRSIAPR